MARSFIVVGEARTAMTDLNRLFVEFDKVNWRQLCRLLTSLGLPKYRIKRILREHVLDIGHEQLLMLLLMMNTKCDKRLQVGQKVVVSSVYQVCNLRVYNLAITPGLLD